MIEDKQQKMTKEDDELDDFTDDLSKNVDFKPAPTQSKEQVSQRKEIDIDWDAVPYIFGLRDKMKKALDLKLEHTSGEATFLVKNGAEPHTVTENSCDCKDWEVNGTSNTPCKHILRVKFTDEQLNAFLEKKAPEEVINGEKEKIKDEVKIMETRKGKVSSPEKIVENQQIVAIEDEDDELLFIPDLTLALPEIGKIKIGRRGDKRTGGGLRLPEKWDHFKIGKLTKDEEGRIEIDKEMTEALGEDKTEIDISLCYDSPGLNMPHFLARFTMSKLACMGNGRKAWQRQEDGTRKEIVCNRKECKYYKDKKCGPYAILSTILTKANRVGGVYVFRTGSWNSIRNIKSSMAFILNRTKILAGIPLKLKVRHATAMPNGLNKRVTIYVVNLEYEGTLEQLDKDAIKEIKRRTQLGTNMYELEQMQKGAIVEQVKTEMEEDAEEIAGEFYSNEEAKTE